MSGECRTYEIEMHTEFWWENLKDGDRLEELCVSGCG